jgi:hypothetical protein
MREKHMFLNALRFFDVKDSECRESCDNNFIDAAIAAWHGSAEQFNDHIRTNVFSSLQEKLGTTHLPWRYALTSAFPVLCYNVDGIAGSVSASQPFAAIFVRAIYTICGYMFFWPAVIHFAFFLCETCRGRENELFILSCLKSILIVVVLSVCLLIEDEAWNMTITSSMPFATLGLAVAYCLLGAWLWCPCSFKASNTSPSDANITEESIIDSRRRVSFTLVERIPHVPKKEKKLSGVQEA